MSTASFHKSILAVSFVVGAVGIVAFRMSGESGTEVQWYGMVWSVTVIFLYLLLAWIPSRSGSFFDKFKIKTDPEIVGDNCYYLGFVFTLVSLAITLYLLLPSDSETLTSDILGDVISGFGIALVSTIVGIALRVLHIRVRPDIDVLSHDSRRELAAAVHDFRGNLSASLRALKDFAIETQQVLSEKREDMRKMAAEDAKMQRQALTEMQRQALTESVEAQVRALGDALRPATKKAVTIFTDSVAEAAVAGHEELVARVAGMRARVSDLAHRETEAIEALIKDVERTRDEVSQFGNALSLLARNLDSSATDVFGRLDPAIDMFRNKISGVAETLAVSDSALLELAGKLEVFGAGISGQFDPAVGTLQDRISTTTETLAKSNAALSSLANHLDSANTDIPERLQHAAEMFHGKLTRTAEALADIDYALSRLAERFDATSADMSERLDPAASAFRSEIIKATETLVNASEALETISAKLAQLVGDAKRVENTDQTHRRPPWWRFGRRRTS